MRTAGKRLPRSISLKPTKPLPRWLKAVYTHFTRRNGPLMIRKHNIKIWWICSPILAIILRTSMWRSTFTPPVLMLTILTTYRSPLRLRWTVVFARQPTLLSCLMVSTVIPTVPWRWRQAILVPKVITLCMIVPWTITRMLNLDCVLTSSSLVMCLRVRKLKFMPVFIRGPRLSNRFLVTIRMVLPLPSTIIWVLIKRSPKRFISVRNRKTSRKL